MDQRAQRHGRIDAAAGDHHVGALGQRPRDREAAEIGVHAGDALGQLGAGVHLADVGLAQLLDARLQVVAQHQRDLERHARRLAGLQHGVAAGLRVHAAGIGDDLDLPVGDLLGQRPEHRDEIRRIARLRVAQLLRRHDRHGDLGEIVAHQVVDLAVAHELRGGGLGVAPEAGMAADADGLAMLIPSACD